MLPSDMRKFGIYVNNGNFSIDLGGFNEKFIAKGKEREGYGIHWYPLLSP